MAIVPNDKDIRTPINLRVIHKDGSEDIISDGGVVFQGGANISFEVAEDDDLVNMSANPGSGTEDPYYRQKYNSLAGLTVLNNGGNPIAGPFFDPDLGLTPSGPAWVFTRESMWIGAINNTPGSAVSNVFFVNSSACSNLGQFDTDDGYPEVLPYELSILDICIPCTDCDIWNRLNEYIDRLDEFYDYQLDLVQNENTSVPPEHPDGGTPNTYSGIYPQVLSSQRFWDYLVHNGSLKFSSESQGQSVVVATYYNNISTGIVGDGGGNGVTITYEYGFYRNGILWAGVSDTLLEPRLLAREGSDNPPDNIRTYTLNSVFTTTKITVTMTTFDNSLPGPRLVPSGGVLYSDLVLLIKDFTQFDDDAEYYVDITMTIDRTHLIAPGNPTGTRMLSTRVFFVPSEEPPSSSSS